MPGLFVLVLLAERLIAPVSQMSGDVQASGCHGHLLVTWRDGNSIVAAVDGKTMTVSTSTRGTPAAACGSSSWLVTWPSSDFGVDGRRVALDGTLLAPITIFRGAFGASEVAASYGTNQFLVAWADGVTIRAARLSDSGAVIDTTPIAVAPEGFFVSPRIVWTGTTFFAGWAEKSSNPFLTSLTRLWGTRVSADGHADPVVQPLTGSGTGALQFSLTAAGDRITYAWVAQHGTETCVDLAAVNGVPKSFRCSGDGFGDGVPVVDQAQVLASRGETILVWRELMPDFKSALRAARAGVDTPPYDVVSTAGFGAGLTMTSDGAAVVYFAGFPTNVYMRAIPQEPTPVRRRAARH